MVKFIGNLGKQIKLTIDAKNNADAGKTGCQGNPGGLVFAVVSNDCPCSSGNYYDSVACGCLPCIAGCLNCPDQLTCTTCNSAPGYVLDAITKTCVCNGVGSCTVGTPPVCGNSVIEGS